LPMMLTVQTAAFLAANERVDDLFDHRPCQ